MKEKHVVIIGGGITGLTAAYELTRLKKEKKLGFRLSLLEARNRLGGVITTEKKEGFLLEHGPDAFLTAKPSVLELCQSLELQSELLPTKESQKKAFVALGSRLIPLPDGFYLLAPSRLGAFCRTPLLSWKGKLRVLLEPFVPAAVREDESLASFVRRRFGQEILDRIAQPLVSSIYASDPEKLSLRATMPQFLEMERKHKSILLALKKKKDAIQASGARFSLFMTLKNGLQTLVDALEKALPKESILRHAKVVAMLRTKDHWQLVLEDQRKLDAEAVILALPAKKAQEIVKSFDGNLAESLSLIPYHTTIVANLAFRKVQFACPLTGFGFVVPKKEKRSLLACSFSSQKFKGRAPESCVLLRCFLGGELQPEAMKEDDEKLLGKLVKDLSFLLGLSGKPLFATIHRHIFAMPQYPVHHSRLVEKIEALRQQHHGLFLAGNAYRGIGIPDCILSGRRAAQAVCQMMPTG